MSGLALPPPDRTLSPFTGWTRAHWEAVADHLLTEAWRHGTPARAGLRLPGHRPGDADDLLEGFARTFLLAAARGPGCGRLDQYADGLAAGTDPHHRESWPVIGHHTQPLVEAAALAVALHWTRSTVWDGLDDPVRQRIVDWLSGATGRWSADNNHVLFGATVQAFLHSVGAPHSRAALERALGRADDWYCGDGWYSDGPGRRFDHYNAWTFHFYPLLIAEMLGSDGAELAATHRCRLRAFLDDYQHLVGADGAPVLIGRSLIYRFGIVAPFWLGALHDATPLSAGRTRRLASGVVRHFIDRGVGVDRPLGLGWYDDFAGIRQSYSGPASPYWASKAFLGLLLPPAHPAWTATEEPLEVELTDVVRALPGPGWLVHGTRSDGVVRVLNHGSDGHPRQDDPHYRRLAYSTRSAPVVEGPVRDNCVDVVLAAGAAVHRGLSGGVARHDTAASRFRLDAGGRDVVVDVASTCVGPAEVRVARVIGAVALPLRVTGYPVSGAAHVDAGDGWVRATLPTGLNTTLATLGAGGRLRVASSNVGTALGAPAWIPAWDVDADTVNEARLAWLVALAGERWDPTELLVSLQLEWTADGADLVVGTRTRALAWCREPRWPADCANQGVFQAG